MANANDLSGALYRIPGDADELRRTLAELAQLGFSDRFRRIIADLYRREVAFAWFNETRFDGVIRSHD